jgi:hypothetical protein
MAKKKIARSSPPPAIAINYTRSGDFRVIVAHGALIRPIQDALVLTFYVDDRRAISQEGRLMAREPATYELGMVTEVAERLEQVAIQLSLADAVALMRVIHEQVAKLRPELIGEMSTAAGSVGKV